MIRNGSIRLAPLVMAPVAGLAPTLALTLALALFLLACAGQPAEADVAARDPRPNLLLILLDDVRNDTLGCTGHPLVQTPAIDQLAAAGTLFEQAFVTTSICAASRATIFTGLLESSHGYTFGKPPIPAAATAASYPVRLRDAGYHTGFIGKFGVKFEGRRGTDLFDEFSAIGTHPYFRPLDDGSTRHETDLCGDRAVDFLRRAPADRPFCLSLSFNAAHAEDGDLDDHFPFPPGVADLYQGVDMPPPRLADPAIFAALPEFLQNSLNRQRWFWRWDTGAKYQHNMRNYLRMISGVDRVVARLREELQRSGAADHTVILVLADNGYYMGDRGFAGKWSHYEQSLRIPMVIYDPRLGASDRGRRSAAMVLNLDVAPTLLELAGVDLQAVPTQGRSLVPLLNGPMPVDWRRRFYAEHRMEHEAIPQWEGVRGQRYSYAHYYQYDHEFLHDLGRDPDQLVNLAGDPRYTGLIEEMRRHCRDLAPGLAPTPR